MGRSLKTSTIVIIGVVVIAVTVFLAFLGILGEMASLSMNTQQSRSENPSTTTPSPTYTPQPKVTPSPEPKVTPNPKPVASITISYVYAKKEYVVVTLDSIGAAYRPDSGKVFLEVNMTIKNNGYDSFSTSPFYFYAIADNVKYDYDWRSDLETVDVLNGGTFKGTLVFQIPSTAESITIGYESWSSYNIVWTKT